MNNVMYNAVNQAVTFEQALDEVEARAKSLAANDLKCASVYLQRVKEIADDDLESIAEESVNEICAWFSKREVQALVATYLSAYHREIDNNIEKIAVNADGLGTIKVLDLVRFLDSVDLDTDEIYRIVDDLLNETN